jgi:hypothetical protein
MKNGGGGGGGSGRARAPQNDYGDRSYGQQSYGGQQSQASQSQAQAPTATGAEDPYAACKQRIEQSCKRLTDKLQMEAIKPTWHSGIKRWQHNSRMGKLQEVIHPNLQVLPSVST